MHPFMSRPAPALAALLATMLVALPAAAQPAAGTERTISVSGSAEVEAVPNRARVSAGVETQADTAAEAMAANSATMSGVFAALEAAGIEARDIQTSNLSLGAVWDHNRDSDEPPRIVGYQASNVVNVRLRDVSALGSVIDAVTGAGANRLNGIGFELSDRQAAIDEAREGAVADARARAELYARAAGVTLGPVITIRESEQHAQPFMARAAMESMDSTPIAEGSVAIRAQVSMVFGIE